MVNSTQKKGVDIKIQLGSSFCNYFCMFPYCHLFISDTHTKTSLVWDETIGMGHWEIREDHTH